MHTKLMTGLLVGSAALVGFSPIAVAVTTSDCCPSLEIGLTGGWYSAFNANSAYAVKGRNTTDDVPVGDIVRVSSKHKFAGGVSLNYQTDCCYNWGATYLWHKNRNHGSTGPNAALILAPATADFNTYSSAAASTYQYRHDFGNVEMGSTICVVADCLTINPKIGVSYGRFRNHQTTVYSPPIAGGGALISRINVDQQSTFSGVGPSIGADVNYTFCEGLSLLGNIRYSGIIGTLKGYYSAVGATPPVVLAPTQNFTSSRHFASVIQSELGLGYGFDWGGYCGSISAGYQLTKGFNTYEKVENYAAARASERILDSGDHGPFVRLTMRFGM